eukprot:1373772-Amorphochlora_amoeboformis.AAC.1
MSMETPNMRNITQVRTLLEKSGRNKAKRGHKVASEAIIWLERKMGVTRRPSAPALATQPETPP